MRTKYLLVISIFFTLWFAGMLEVKSKEDSQKYDYTVISDIPYKEGKSDYEQQRCKLDLYLPTDCEDFPVLIWFHGGGLKGGDKNVDMSTQVGKRFASAGFGVVMVNYRLYPKVKYPEYIRDAASSFGWVYFNIKHYKGNPRQIFVCGHSAGGYLTAMIGMDKRYLSELNLSTDHIAGIIPVSGQMNSHSTVREERGIPGSNVVIDESAPIFYVRKDAPPCLSICGGNDLPGRSAENKKFIKALSATGHTNCEFEEIAGRDHSTIITIVSSKDDIVAEKMLLFMKKIVNGSKNERKEK